MAVRLFKLEQHPRRIAISGTETFVVGGAFFLDFTRPLVLRRYLGVGPVSGMFVPVIHEGEREGSYVVDVDRDNAYFADIQELWRQRFPSTAAPPEHFHRRQDILAHFAAQFSIRKAHTPPAGVIRRGSSE